MVWALTHVVRPGDSITLLALLASRRQPWKFINFSLSRVLYCTAKLANNIYMFSQEPDLHARRRIYISGHILV